jgi:hypothetical protein
VYTPAADFFGADSFTYRISDDEEDSEIATVNITVIPVNDAPDFGVGTRGSVQEVVVTEDIGPVVLPGWAVPGPDNESNQRMTVRVTNDSPGLFAVPPDFSAAGELSFTAAPDANGAARVTIIVQDDGGTASGGTDTSTLTLALIVLPVNDPPAAQPQSVSLNEDSPVVIRLQASDPDGDPLVYTVAAPAHGRLSGTAPDLIYTPATNYFGPDSFSFTVNDDERSATAAAVQLTVLPVNDPPVAVAQASPRVTLDHRSTNLLVVSPNNSNALVVLDGSASSDPEGDPLHYSWSESDARLAFASGVRVTNTLAVGVHAITLQASDGAAFGEDSLLLEVVSASEAVEELNSLVSETALDRQSKRPLSASLKAAAASVERGRFKAGANQLRAFQNKLRAQVAAQHPAIALALFEASQSIVDALEPAENPVR